MIELTEWLKRRDTIYVPIVRGESDTRRNISDGTPFGTSLLEAVMRDLMARIEVLEEKAGVEPTSGGNGGETKRRGRPPKSA